MLGDATLSVPRAQLQQSNASGDALVAFSAGLCSKEAAISAVGARDYAQLLLLLGQRELPLPRLPAAEVDAMADTFVRVVQAAQAR